MPFLSDSAKHATRTHSHHFQEHGYRAESCEGRLEYHEADKSGSIEEVFDLGGKIAANGCHDKDADDGEGDTFD